MIAWLAAAALLAGIALAALVLSFRRSLPREAGAFRVRGVKGTVEVIRDVDGVPHVYAGDRRDAYFGLGWVHAQDRLWQMELQRRFGMGRLAEVMGKLALPSDRFVRIVGVHRAAESAWEALPADAREAVEGYVAGINAFLAAHRGSRLPPELRLLRVRPEPWTPRDVTACAKMMAWSLAGTYVGDLLRADLAAELGPERACELFPDLAGAPAALPFTGIAPAPGAAAAGDDPTAGLLHVPGAGGEGIGSNQWVVSGSRSETGQPVLASDPHLPSSIPSTWYVAHLSAPGLDAVGATVPGLPVVAAGRNPHLAWGVTSMGHDVQDLFHERLSGDGRLAEYRGAWEPVEEREETIRIRGAKDVTIRVRSTRHGPLISDALNANTLAVPAKKRCPPRDPIAFRWTALDPGDTSLASLLAVARARDWESFAESFRGYVAPVIAFNYADVRGNIATVVAGKIPVRAGGDGSLPAEGWSGKGDWEGWIPFDEMPRVFNPGSGAIVSANTPVLPDGYPHFLGRDFMEPHRRERITELLDARDRLAVADHQAIQADTVSLHARRLLPLLLPLVTPSGDRERRAMEMLAAWDCDMRPDSAAAALFAAWWVHLPGALAGPLEGRLFRGWEMWSSHVDRFVRRTLEAGADDPARRKANAAAAAESLKKALATVEKRLGERMERWRWDGLHAAVFAHQPFHALPPLRRFFSRSVPTGGDWSTVNVGGTWPSARPFEQRYVAGYRQVVDLSDPDGGRFIQAVGQSGHFLSPRYDDYAADWRAVRYRPMRLTRAAVESARAATLWLESDPAATPAPSGEEPWT